MLGFPRAEQQIPAGNRAEGERLPLCSTEPGGALPALRCSCCLWEPLTFVVPLAQPCPRFPTPWCHRGPSGPGGCEATIAPFLVLLSWENLSHSWGKGNENRPRCSRRWMAGTAVNGGSNPGCGTSPNPCISRRAGLQVGSSLKHSRQQVSMAGMCVSPCPSQIRAVSICGKLRASLQLSEGSSLWKWW